jgi:hypothetical protein
MGGEARRSRNRCAERKSMLWPSSPRRRAPARLRDARRFRSR